MNITLHRFLGLFSCRPQYVMWRCLAFQARSSPMTAILDRLRAFGEFEVMICVEEGVLSRSIPSDLGPSLRDCSAFTSWEIAAQCQQHFEWILKAGFSCQNADVLCCFSDQIVIFGDKVILEEPVDKWVSYMPCHCGKQKQYKKTFTVVRFQAQCPLFKCVFFNFSVGYILRLCFSRVRCTSCVHHVVLIYSPPPYRCSSRLLHSLLEGGRCVMLSSPFTPLAFLLLKHGNMWVFESKFCWFF